MKIKILLSIVVLSLSLTGCATTILNEFQHYNPNRNDTWESGIALQDQLIAIGIASQPIQGHENALIIVGQKYSYLAKPVISDKQTATLLMDLVNNIDMQYAKLYQDESEQKLKNIGLEKMNLARPIVFRLAGSKQVKDHQLTAHLVLQYQKPVKLVTASEREKLSRIKMVCMENEQYYECNKRLNIQLTLATAVKNQNQLKHRFQQPLDLIVQYSVREFNAKEVAKNMALYPLAITFDIVTSPIQLIGLLTWKTPHI